jgi:hypothetical protein
MIIGLSGKRRVGKDTTANILVSEFGYIKMSFADELKIMCSKVFNIDIKYFYDDDLKDEKFVQPLAILPRHVTLIASHVAKHGFIVTKEMVTKMDSIGIGQLMDTPRQLLQFVGTEIIRNVVDSKIWIIILNKKLKTYEGNAIIQDGRFSNERAALRDAGAMLCLIKRPSLSNQDTHASENDLGEDYEYDDILMNDDTQEKYEDFVRNQFMESIEMFRFSKNYSGV